MPDNIGDGLAAASKALRDVVKPALTDGDPVAAEQLNLVLDYLGFLEARCDHLYARDLWEMVDRLALAEALQESAHRVSSVLASNLVDAMSQGRQVQTAPGAPIGEIRRAAERVGVATRELIRASQSAEEKVRRAIEREVLQHSGNRIEVDRAWYAPLHLGSDAGEGAPLADLLRT